MVNVRPQHDPFDQGHPSNGHARGARFNVLLTEDRPHSGDHWTNQLPRLLKPQGVAAFMAQSGRQAIGLAERLEIHAAVIDLGTPLDDPAGSTTSPLREFDSSPAGLWLLELFRRLPNRPPIVVINSPAYSQRKVQRLMHEALRLGAFSIINKPVGIEQVLDVFRRVMDRQYHGTWPNTS